MSYNKNSKSIQKRKINYQEMNLVMKHSTVGGCALQPLIASNLNQTTSYCKTDDLTAVETRFHTDTQYKRSVKHIGLI